MKAAFAGSVRPFLVLAFLAAAPAAGAAQQSAAAPAAEVPVTLTAEERASYVGVYELETPDGMMSIQIYEEGERLMGLPEHDEEPSPLTPLGEHRFRPILMPEAVITFSVEDGHALNFAIDFPDERGTVFAFRRK